MSYTELKVIMPDGEILGSMEFKNSHGFAAFVWTTLVNKYKIPGFVYIAWENLWTSVREGKTTLNAWEYNALMSTYDNVLVKREDMALLATSYRRFHEAHYVGEHISHLEAIAEAIEKELEDPKTQGIGFYAMSVGEDPWEVYEEGENEDEDEGEYRPYNVNKDDKHWFAELKPLP